MTFGILPLAIMAATALIIVCRDGTSDFEQVESFGKWFTGTSPEPPGNVGRMKESEIKSIVQSYRQGSFPGKDSVYLCDIRGRMYAVGYSTPQTIRQDTLYPCIVYLHGGTGGDRNDKGKHAWEMFDMLSDSIQLFLVSPSADRKALWWSSDGMSRIFQTIRYMALHFPINPDKVFLAGVSDGATGCYAVANSAGAPFAGFIAISGFGGMLQEFGVELYPENLMQCQIYTINAGMDRLYPITMVNEFLNRLESSGVGIRRKVYENEEHGFAYRYHEAGTICSLVREWSRLSTNSINGKFRSDIPCITDHIIEVELENVKKIGSVSAFCVDSTFFIKSSGIKRMKMYFNRKDTCRTVSWNCNGEIQLNQKLHPPHKKDVFMIMWKRCFPEVRETICLTLKK